LREFLDRVGELVAVGFVERIDNANMPRLANQIPSRSP